jgi:hypothetical protein
MTLDISPTQRDVLDRMLAALPTEVVAEPLSVGGELTGMFYHPNAACRVEALVLSAGLDVASGRTQNATKKIQRALQVFTLVTDDSFGRGLLQDLEASLEEDAAGALQRIRETVVPFLEARLRGEDPPAPTSNEAEAEPPDEPEAVVEEVAAETEEILDAPDDESNEDAVEAEAEASDDAPATPVEVDEASEAGPSEAEAAAAAAAALAAIEAPYEEVVEDDAPPRFDPDRDLKPEDTNRRRRRRSRGLQGLERPRPDEVSALDVPEPPVVASESSAETGGEQEEGDSFEIRVARSGSLNEISEVGLEVLKQCLRRIREAECEGRLRLELVVTKATDSDSGGRRNRRRRRGRSRSQSRS